MARPRSLWKKADSTAGRMAWRCMGGKEALPGQPVQLRPHPLRAVVPGQGEILHSLVEGGAPLGGGQAPFLRSKAGAVDGGSGWGRSVDMPSSAAS